MRKLILLMHVSVDGFVAGPNGEMDWIKFDEEISDYVGQLTDSSDTAIYGRTTYQMMESYWPTAAEDPNASKHDIQHANWVNRALKVVASRSMERSEWANTRIIRDDLLGEISKMKNEPGENLLLIGSASIAHAFMEHNLIDEYWINVNPVILGTGIPLFQNIHQRLSLELIQAKTFASGVVGLTYGKLKVKS
jgi:dihydrofolate reductase